MRVAIIPLSATLDEVTGNVENDNDWKQKPASEKKEKKQDELGNMIDIYLICNNLQRGKNQTQYNFKSFTNFFALEAAIKFIYKNENNNPHAS